MVLRGGGADSGAVGGTGALAVTTGMELMAYRAQPTKVSIAHPTPTADAATTTVSGIPNRTNVRVEYPPGRSTMRFV